MEEVSNRQAGFLHPANLAQSPLDFVLIKQKGINK
jgi:hypothetical protein